MLTEELNYDLPEELIAQEPVSKRDESRLLVMSLVGGQLTDRRFGNIVEYLSEGDWFFLHGFSVIGKAAPNSKG